MPVVKTHEPLDQEILRNQRHVSSRVFYRVCLFYARVIRGGETFPGAGFLNFFSSFFFSFFFQFDNIASTTTQRRRRRQWMEQFISMAYSPWIYFQGLFRVVCILSSRYWLRHRAKATTGLRRWLLMVLSSGRFV